MKIWYFRDKHRNPLGCTTFRDNKISWSWCDKEDTFKKKTAVKEAIKKENDLTRFNNVPLALIPQVIRMAKHFGVEIGEVRNITFSEDKQTTKNITPIR